MCRKNHIRIALSFADPYMSLNRPMKPTCNFRKGLDQDLARTYDSEFLCFEVCLLGRAAINTTLISNIERNMYSSTKLQVSVFQLRMSQSSIVLAHEEMTLHQTHVSVFA